jgi:hypothetical protein
MLTFDEAITVALTPPDEFAYHGSRALFETWGVTPFEQPRGSDPLAQSNFAVISGDLTARFPDDVAVERFHHWACGWIDTLLVRVKGPNGTATEAFRAVHEWCERLAHYPAADDTDLSAREHEALLATLADSYGVAEDQADAVARLLFDEHSVVRAEECTGEAVADALAHLGRGAAA